MSISIIMEKVVDELLSAAYVSWESAVEHFSYQFQLENKLEDLKTTFGDLKELKESVVRRVQSAEQGGMEQISKVVLWIERINRAEAEVGELLREGDQEVGRLCLRGFCSTNFFRSHRVGEKVAKSLQELANLKATGAHFEEVAVPGERYLGVPAEPDSGAERTCGPTVGLETKLKEVLCYLEEERAGIVGVYGQAGVGKTTLLKKISNHFVWKFDCFVIWIDVPDDLNLESIQQDLGEKIGLPDELTDKSLELKSAYICKQLQRKKIILLLDDIKGAVDLSKIGVPPAESLNESRVVFTTRLEQVCNQMEPQPDKSFSVETLEEEQAWQLFLMKAGQDTINSHPEIPRLAKTVANKCGGLPLALTIIGKSMSCEREPKAWEHAIKTFDRPALQHSQDREHEHAMSELFSLLRYSYDNLPSDMVRSCFSYCALFPEGHEIAKGKLVELWTFEDFWMDIDSHYDEANCILSTLVRASLLEDNGLWVKMHDVIRSMALWISKGDALVMAGKQLKQAPRVGKWKAMKRVSLMENEIEELGQVPECPNLVTLLLNGNTKLREICPQFFQSMSNLTILNLSNTMVKELPGSISRLVSLTFLDISNTEIERLPIELTELKMLKYLNLFNLYLTFERSEQVVRKLSSLRVLKMLCSYSYYEEEGCEGEGEAANNMLSDDQMLLEELQYLEHLNVLEITILSLSGLEKLISTRRLWRKIETLCLSHFKAPSIDVSLLAHAKNLDLSIISCDFSELSVDATKGGAGSFGRSTFNYKPFSGITRVAVCNCDYLEQLTCFALMPNLAVLIVSDCMALKEVISGEKLQKFLEVDRSLEPFYNLAVLELCLLPRLRHIYSSNLSLRSLHQLRVCDCPRLKKLPLGSTSVKGPQIELIAEKDWFDAIEWEDDATKAALRFRLNLSQSSVTDTGRFPSKPMEMWPGY